MGRKRNNTNCFVLVRKTTGTIITEAARLPIFWRKEIAKERAADFAFTKIKAIPLQDIQRLLFVPSFQAMESERMEWSLKTFPNATPASSLLKLKEEVKEIEVCITPDPEEYADALMCLFDSAGRAGISVDDIAVAFRDKLAKNKRREWKENPDKTYSHIKK